MCQCFNSFEPAFNRLMIAPVLSSPAIASLTPTSKANLRTVQASMVEAHSDFVTKKAIACGVAGASHGISSFGDASSVLVSVAALAVVLVTMLE
jgi:hypothetical protein